jgi:hypothetical protein
MGHQAVSLRMLQSLFANLLIEIVDRFLQLRIQG